MSVDGAPGTSDARSAGPAATLTRRDGVAIITLNRPKALNAVNAELSVIVGAALEELDSDPSLRVGVITGKGRAFCAGADLKAIAAGQSLAAPGHEDWGFAGLTEHYIAKPLIAADVWAANAEAIRTVFASDDAKEGPRAFGEKRAPRWTGR
jgi:crotonobetainyl-CoA hydratase